MMKTLFILLLAPLLLIFISDSVDAGHIEFCVTAADVKDAGTSDAIRLKAYDSNGNVVTSGSSDYVGEISSSWNTIKAGETKCSATAVSESVYSVVVRISWKNAFMLNHLKLTDTENGKVLVDASYSPYECISHQSSDCGGNAKIESSREILDWSEPKDLRDNEYWEADEKPSQTSSAECEPAEYCVDPDGLCRPDAVFTEKGSNHGNREDIYWACSEGKWDRCSDDDCGTSRVLDGRTVYCDGSGWKSQEPVCDVEIDSETDSAGEEGDPQISDGEEVLYSLDFTEDKMAIRNFGYAYKGSEVPEDASLSDMTKFDIHENDGTESNTDGYLRYKANANLSGLSGQNQLLIWGCSFERPFPTYDLVEEDSTILLNYTESKHVIRNTVYAQNTSKLPDDKSLSDYEQLDVTKTDDSSISEGSWIRYSGTVDLSGFGDEEVEVLVWTCKFVRPYIDVNVDEI